MIFEQHFEHAILKTMTRKQDMLKLISSSLCESAGLIPSIQLGHDLREPPTEVGRQLQHQNRFDAWHCLTFTARRLIKNAPHSAEGYLTRVKVTGPIFHLGRDMMTQLTDG